MFFQGSFFILIVFYLQVFADNWICGRFEGEVCREKFKFTVIFWDIFFYEYLINDDILKCILHLICVVEAFSDNRKITTFY